MTPPADALAAKHPLAATVVLRAMIDFSLRNARSSRYRHAARHLLDCSSLAPRINDFRQLEPHEAYEARLRREHRKKSSFWSFVDSPGGKPAPPRAEYLIELHADFSQPVATVGLSEPEDAVVNFWLSLKDRSARSRGRPCPLQ